MTTTVILIVLAVVICTLVVLYLKEKPKKIGSKDIEDSVEPDIEDVRPEKPKKI